MASTFWTKNRIPLRQVGPVTNSQRRAERLTQVIDPETLIRWAQVSRKTAIDWYINTGTVPNLNRDLPLVKELFARYVNTRGQATVPSLMHWDTEAEYWRSVCSTEPGAGVKALRTPVQVMAALVEFCSYCPYYDPATGRLALPAETIVVRDDAEDPIKEITTWARALQLGEDPGDIMGFAWKWYKKHFGEE